ncbi:UPF0711 protein C18orf21 homolog isoform X2 [Rhinatrema bivittatum]|uniref:UPF0711 protein C18orf21 homolog isoform X2 n=1 Tax=Rhinatrema bivittatum TaxID=194408 RepID=UPI00112D0E97|nr:UPF0711 protein C18orf21 homolog isoform X2 [Rhinatrema bivittatum]
MIYTRSGFQTIKTTLEKICPFCFQCLIPGNYTVRLKPKMKASSQIQKLLKLEGKCHRLDLKQIKLLRRYKVSRSLLMVTCNMCKKITKYPGTSRSLLAAASSGSSTPKFKHGMKIPDVKTPTSGRKSNFAFVDDKPCPKSRSPAITPRTCNSSSSSPSTSTKSARKSKFHFSRLKMLLNQDKKPTSKKGNLQNFLSML